MNGFDISLPEPDLCSITGAEDVRLEEIMAEIFPRLPGIRVDLFMKDRVYMCSPNGSVKVVSCPGDPLLADGNPNTFLRVALITTKTSTKPGQIPILHAIFANGSVQHALETQLLNLNIVGTHANVCPTSYGEIRVHAYPFSTTQHF